MMMANTLAATGAYAETIEDVSLKYTSYAEKLSKIGVFVGTGNSFELEREPTRTEALVILIRLLGREEEALKMTEAKPVFYDVPVWAWGYVNYAYENGLTKGISATEFGSYRTIEPNSFLTFVLRSLGYDDQKGDFAWKNADAFAFQIGLIDETLATEIDNGVFLRDHVAKISYNALQTAVKPEEDMHSRTLGVKLVEDGHIRTLVARSINLIDDDYIMEMIEGNGNAEDTIAPEIDPEDMTDTEVPESDPEYADSGEADPDESNQDESDSKDTNHKDEDTVSEDDTEGDVIADPASAITANGETSLLGPPTAPREQVWKWAKGKGMSMEGLELIDIYYEICEEKGLNPVIQYVQMVIETGWLYRVESQAGIDASYHNPCGLKTTAGGSAYDPNAHMMFDSWHDGIDAIRTIRRFMPD